MKNIFKDNKITDAKIEIIEPNYEGIAHVIKEFRKLYRVCENKELLDKCLENFFDKQVVFVKTKH